MFFKLKLQKGNVEHYYDFGSGLECLFYEFVCDALTYEENLLYYEGMKKMFDDLIIGFNVVFREA